MRDVCPGYASFQVSGTVFLEPVQYHENRWARKGADRKIAKRFCAAAARRKGLQRKARRKRIGASEDLERKARIFCPREAGKKRRPNSELYMSY
jgi:hypothetical protein